MADATQEAILEAAFTAVLTHGYDGATTRRIAALAGVNEVTLFRKFGTKARLLEQVVAREAEQLLAHVIRYTGDLEADLVHVVEGYQGLLGRRAAIMPILLSELPRRPELRSLVTEPLKAVQALVGLIMHYQADGQLQAGPPQQLLVALMAPLVANALAAHHAPGFFPPLDAPSHVRRLLSGHGAGKGQAHARS